MSLDLSVRWALDFQNPYRYSAPSTRGPSQGVEVQTHYPKITNGPDRTWVVECIQCRNDTQSDLPIGIGMPLQDRETAERLRDNHALRTTRVAAS
jgi:hypothetical protein